MTNELEKQFFQRFGIEPKKGCTAYYKFIEEEADVICNDKCAECSYLDDVYPQITDRILLELIFILTTLLDTTIYEDVFITVAKNREELKKDIFQECMLYKQHIKQQVRALFEEE